MFITAAIAFLATAFKEGNAVLVPLFAFTLLLLFHSLWRLAQRSDLQLPWVAPSEVELEFVRVAFLSLLSWALTPRALELRL